MLGEFLMAAASQPFILGVAIILATFVLEDAATIAVAVLASQMVIDPQLALGALLFGTVAGDLALYALARWASASRLVQRLALGSAPAARLLGWLSSHALLLTLIARFTPGLRLPVYLGAGAARVPFVRFALVVTGSALVWTPGLFWATSALDDVGLAKLGAWSWVLAAGLAALLLLTARVTRQVLARSAG